MYDNLLPDGNGRVEGRVTSERRMPIVVREVPSVTTQRSLSDDEGEIDQSLANDSHSSTSQNVDGNTMLGAINKIADVKCIFCYCYYQFEVF